MSRLRSVGIAATVAAIVGVVSVPVMKAAFAPAEITVSGPLVADGRPLASGRAAAWPAGSPAAAPGSSVAPSGVRGPLAARSESPPDRAGGSAPPGPGSAAAPAAPGASAGASLGAAEGTDASNKANLVGPHQGADAASRVGGAGEASAPPETAREIVVHVAGAVRRPGVYHLHAGARNDDAVRAAGGLARAANEASVNLAAPAVDGSQLYVKSEKEQPSGGADGASGAASEMAHPAARHVAAAGPARTTRPAGSGSSAKPVKLKDPSEGRINLNTATEDELQRVRGVGPAMAQKILAFREQNHGFKTVEDLTEISGVGAKTYAKLAPFFKVK